MINQSFLNISISFWIFLFKKVRRSIYNYFFVFIMLFTVPIQLSGFFKYDTIRFAWINFQKSLRASVVKNQKKWNHGGHRNSFILIFLQKYILGGSWIQNFSSQACAVLKISPILECVIYRPEFEFAIISSFLMLEYSNFTGRKKIMYFLWSEN